MKILGIETSTAQGSVAVISDGEVVFEESFSADRAHSSELFSALQRAKKMAGNFDEIAVGLGPGSYSGVRIAIAVAIGMQLTMNARLTGVASVAALDCEAANYIALGDARRSMFYFAVIDQGRCVEGPELIDVETARAKIEQKKLPVFSSAVLADFPGIGITFPTAQKIARRAGERVGILATGNIEPLYLRAAVTS